MGFYYLLCLQGTWSMSSSLAFPFSHWGDYLVPLVWGYCCKFPYLKTREEESKWFYPLWLAWLMSWGFQCSRSLRNRERWKVWVYEDLQCSAKWGKLIPHSVLLKALGFYSSLSIRLNTEGRGPARQILFICHPSFFSFTFFFIWGIGKTQRQFTTELHP